MMVYVIVRITIFNHSLICVPLKHCDIVNNIWFYRSVLGLKVVDVIKDAFATNQDL